MAEVLLANVLQWLRTRIDARSPGDHTDVDLLSRYVGRHDEAAFEAIMRRHGPLVLGVCRRLLHNRQDVEDAFQAVFLILVRKAASLRHRESLAAWLHGVAHRVAVRVRAHAARGGRQQPLGDVARSDPPPEVLWQEVRGVLDEEVQRLPEKYRVPVVLCYLEGRTNEEAARALGCPMGTVAIRLARARDRLRKRLERRGVGTPPSVLAAGLAEFTRPPTIADACIQAALHGATGATTASAPAAALMKGVLRDMFWSKVRFLTALTLTLGLAIVVGFVGWKALAAETPSRASASDKRSDAKSSANEETGSVWKDKGSFSAGKGQLAGIAVSPDGKTIAVALGINSGAPFSDEAMPVQLWDADNFKKVATLKDPKRPQPGVVGSLTFSADGKTLAVGDSTLALWDVGSGKPRCKVSGVEGSSHNAVTFSPNGETVATVRADGVVCIASTETGKLEFASSDGKFVAASSVAFADDGKTLLTAELDFTVKQWNVAKGKVQDAFSLKTKDGFPAILVFASCGKLAATTTTDGSVATVWDLTTHKPRLSIKGRGKGAGVTQLAFAPDAATLAVGAGDGTVTLWDLSTEKELTTLKGHKGSIHRLAFAAEGKTLVSGDEKGNVHVWALER
jgi:RNA polymerase sigma factor (sigma-70 family)